MSEPTAGAEVEDGEAPRTTGEQGRTDRDMQAVTEHVEERSALDMGAIERAVDRLLQIRELDRKRCTNQPYIPQNPLKVEDVNYFMERTGESRADSERQLDLALGDLKTAFSNWIKSPPIGHDYNSEYGENIKI
jgi:hypothetical protein